MKTVSRIAAAAAVVALVAAPGVAGARIEDGSSLTPGVAVQRATSSAAGGGAQGGVPTASGGPAFGSYRWPVRGEVIRPYEPPSTPYAAGHRGIDIAAPFGSPIRAPADGVVSFAGTVAGSLFISIDHDAGIRTSYSWISAIGVKKGQSVRAGAVIGATGQGHPGSDRPHVHFSARLNGVYIDPMLLLGGGNLDDVIHLAVDG